MPLGPSELILNPDGSVYHLNLLPGEVAPIIITVGDPERVAQVSRYFDSIEVQKRKREFHTCTGSLRGKRLTVISTGIGTDNIDIVMNEVDALFNIDFQAKRAHDLIQRLQFVRIGTSGAIQEDIPVDSIVMSRYALGLDGLMHFYRDDDPTETEILQAFMSHLPWRPELPAPYIAKQDESLASLFSSNRIRFGLTVTNSGFYGPQGRYLRLDPAVPEWMEKLGSFSYDDLRITNLEMETAGIFGLSRLLGHQAVSLNCILANRATGVFSKAPDKAVDSLIRFALERITGGLSL